MRQTAFKPTVSALESRLPMDGTGFYTSDPSVIMPTYYPPPSVAPLDPTMDTTTVTPFVPPDQTQVDPSTWMVGGDPYYVPSEQWIATRNVGTVAMTTDS